MRAAITAVSTAALAGLVVLAAYAAGSFLAPAVLVVQLVLLAGWYRVTEAPGERQGIVVIAGAAALADFLPLSRADEPPLTSVAPVLGVGFVAALLAQLTRRDGRSQLTASLTATVTGLALVGSGAMLVASGEVPGGAPLVASVVAATAAGMLAPLLSAVPAVIQLAVAAVLASLAGLAVGSTDIAVGAANGTALGLAAGLVAVLAATVTSYGAVSGRTDRVSLVAVGAALPLLLSGTVAYALGRILTG